MEENKPTSFCTAKDYDVTKTSQDNYFHLKIVDRFRGQPIRCAMRWAASAPASTTTGACSAIPAVPATTAIQVKQSLCSYLSFFNPYYLFATAYVNIRI